MNNMAINNSIAPYRPAIRPPASRTVEQSYGTPNPQVTVSTDVASLSLETRVDLSQKAQVLPPPPPAESKRKPSQPPARKSEAQVETTDFAGRTCSGTLSGPLLMEDPLEVDSLDSRPGSFKTVDFDFKSAQDLGSVRGAGLAFAEMEPEVLHAKASDSPIAILPSSDSTFAYFGVKNGMATIVQQFESRQPEGQEFEDSQVRMPDGQIAFISRGRGPAEQSQVSMQFPASCLDELAYWGRSLLAIA